MKNVTFEPVLKDIKKEELGGGEEEGGEWFLQVEKNNSRCKRRKI